MARESGSQSLNSRLHISLHGAVQGVGFRPFVYRLATEMELNGWVLNSSQGVFIEVEGEAARLDVFLSRLRTDKPPRAYIQGMESALLDPVGYRGFEIRESDRSGEKIAFVIPDIATCPDCSREIFDPGNRRYLYPFTNCTNCGPRFTIIRSLPYDRPNTTMSAFEMCDDCRREYSDPNDRRFHAQPNACPKCGPHLELIDKSGTSISMYHDAMLGAANAIREGKIVALKGIGGFQLIVDAGSDEAVKRLRMKKHREEKPFALLYPSLEELSEDCEISEIESRLLLSPEAPIVLLRRRKTEHAGERVVAPSVAPHNPYLGAMLPYTPLHQILMKELVVPVVATSGNISDEPICIDENEAIAKLGRIADLFLVHNRPIERHADDSVVRIMAGRIQTVRRARGYAPLPVEIKSGPSDQSDAARENRSFLAVGGHQKDTIAINSGRNVFVSQHIGDLSTQESLHAFEKTISDFERLYEIAPTTVCHDAHPDYISTRFAEGTSTGKLKVQHHFAHVASCMAENGLDGEVLGVSWDGTGYGEDGTIWGGEFLVTDGRTYDRTATLRQFRLPGASASVKEPRRTALGLLFEVFGERLFYMNSLDPVKSFDGDDLPVLRQMLSGRLNSPLTTSMGRLFDAVSSIVGLRQIANFEGQGAMELEYAIDETESQDGYDFEIVENELIKNSDRRNYEPIFIVNWEPMIKGILLDKSNSVNAGLISAKFHNALVDVIAAVAKRSAHERVVLSGGCFQNKYLTEKAIGKLTGLGFKPYWHQRVPPNDGGISLGQISVAMRRETSVVTKDEVSAASKRAFRTIR